MEHTPNHPLSFRFLDDEAAIQWLAENETHIQTLLPASPEVTWKG